MNAKYKITVELRVAEEDVNEATQHLRDKVESLMSQFSKEGWQLDWTMHPVLNTRNDLSENGNTALRRQLNFYNKNFQGHSQKKSEKI